MKMRKWLKDLSDGLRNVGNDIFAELEHKVAHGAHELAAALLNQQSGFVMYQRGTHDDAQKEQPQIEREM